MNNVQVNYSAIQNLFKSLEPDNRKRILLTALKAGGNKLVDSTRTLLRTKLGSGATTPNRWNGKTMESGIKLKADKDYCEVSVSIMGDFRLKFFEKGTKQRYTRKTKANRGSIRGLNYFRLARQNESSITDCINESINKSLNKLR